MSSKNFDLPDFLRIVWVNNALRQTWEPILAELQRLSTEMSILRVMGGLAKCCCCRVNCAQLADISNRALDNGMSLLVSPDSPDDLHALTASGVAEKAPDMAVMIGKRGNVALLRDVLNSCDDFETYCDLLGYPECCKNATIAGFNDKPHDYVHRAAVRAFGSKKETHLAFRRPGGPFCNDFFSAIGIREIFHQPCSLACRESWNIRNTLRKLACDKGLGDVLAVMDEVLTWPLQWSSRNGIIEIKAPFFKLMHKGFSEEHVVIDYTSATIPPEMPAGCGHPYSLKSSKKNGSTRRSHSTTRVSDGCTPSEYPPKLPVPYEKWMYEDNGFVSFSAMVASQQAILRFCKRLLPAGGEVIDLGCGNGFLLNRLLAERKDVVPYGVEIDHARIEHAKILLPEFAKNIRCCDIYAVESWPQPSENAKQFSMALIAISRFEERSPTELVRMKNVLTECCSTVLVYDYWKRDLQSVGQDIGVDFLQGAEPTCGIARFCTDEEILNAPRKLPRPGMGNCYVAEASHA